MKNIPTKGRLRTFWFYVITLLLPIAVAAIGYVCFSAIRSVDIYRDIKTNQRGWQGTVHKKDQVLGFKPIPNSLGEEVFPIGPNVPARYDENGFRVPVTPESPADAPPGPDILALGCSFTYGAATLAEDTYPYLVGRALNGKSNNAGVCSYGLSQMLILAKELIPVHQPDYVLVQYSPWLADRALNPFMPSYIGRIPGPYFYEKDQKLYIAPPVFMTRIMDLPISRFRNTPESQKDKFSFLWNVGLPLFFHEDLNMLKYTTFNLLGLIPSPDVDRGKLIQYVYEEIHSIALNNGAKMVIVVLGSINKPMVEVNRSLFPSDALIVYAGYELIKKLPVPARDNYINTYAHWRGYPPTLVDDHPNQKAHQIIADSIVSTIKRNMKSKQ